MVIINGWMDVQVPFMVMEPSSISSSDEEKKKMEIVGSSQFFKPGTRERKFRPSIQGGALFECVSALIG